MSQQEISDFLKSLKTPILKYVYNKDFVPGQTPVYYSGPYWDDKEPAAAIESLLFGSWISSGEKVRSFERAFSTKFNQSSSLMVNSGSSANLVLVKALKKANGWADGSEVIVSPVGFPTTFSAIMESGLKPVFADIEMSTLNFDLNQVEGRITDRTVAVFLSPPLGNPCDMDALVAMCSRKNIVLALDNCDSLGSKWNGRFLNELAAISSCSFYAAHHICTGEGGMVSTNDPKLVTIARSIAWWGRDCWCTGKENLLPNGMCKNRFSKWIDGVDEVFDHKYVFSNIGYNLRPLDMQGAIGLEQLKKFDEIHTRRIASKNTLQAIFEKIGIPGLSQYPQAETSWFGTPLVCPDRATKQKLVGHLEANKIQTRNFFAGNILIHPAYRHLGDHTQYPNADEVLARMFFIGASPHYTQPVFDYVGEVAGKFATSV